MFFTHRFECLHSFLGVIFQDRPRPRKITAILGLGGGQNLMLEVLGINTDKKGKQQKNTAVSGKKGKKLKTASNHSKLVQRKQAAVEPNHPSLTLHSPSLPSQVLPAPIPSTTHPPT